MIIHSVFMFRRKKILVKNVVINILSFVSFQIDRLMNDATPTSVVVCKSALPIYFCCSINDKKPTKKTHCNVSLFKNIYSISLYKVCFRYIIIYKLAS